MKPIALIYDGVLVLMSAAVGFFIGLFGLEMGKLIGMGAWASVIVLTVFAILLFIVVEVMGRHFDSLGGIKPAPAGTKRTSNYEKRRKRNGWIGFLGGVGVAIVASMFLPVEQIMGYF